MLWGRNGLNGEQENNKCISIIKWGPGGRKTLYFLKTQTQSEAIINCALLKTGQNSVKHSTNSKRESKSVDEASNKELPIHWITWHACGSLSIPFTIGSSKRYFIVRLLLPFLVYPSFISFNFSTTLCLYLHHKQTEKFILSDGNISNSNFCFEYNNKWFFYKHMLQHWYQTERLKA